MDSLTAICEDLLALRDQISDTTFRPAADEICARLTLIASRIEALATVPESPEVDPFREKADDEVNF